MDKSSPDVPKAEQAFVSIYVDSEMKARLERLAAENERSLSAQIRLMLKRSLEQTA